MEYNMHMYFVMVDSSEQVNYKVLRIGIYLLKLVYNIYYSRFIGVYDIY